MFIDELIQELVAGTALKYNKIDDCLYRLDTNSISGPIKSGRNPCAEITLRCEIWLKVADVVITVEDCLSYNLSDPSSIGKLMRDFRDLHALKKKINKTLLSRLSGTLTI